MKRTILRHIENSDLICLFTLSLSQIHSLDTSELATIDIMNSSVIAICLPVNDDRTIHLIYYSNFRFSPSVISGFSITCDVSSGVGIFGFYN